MTLQLFVNRFEIRLRALWRPLLVLTIAEQRSFEPLVVPVVRQRPAKPSRLATLQVVTNSGLAKRATARDLHRLRADSP